MAKIKIEFSTDNAAFETVGDIYDQLINIANMYHSNYFKSHHKIYDINGNYIGNMVINDE